MDKEKHYDSRESSGKGNTDEIPIAKQVQSSQVYGVPAANEPYAGVHAQPPYNASYGQPHCNPSYGPPPAVDAYGRPIVTAIPFQAQPQMIANNSQIMRDAQGNALCKKCSAPYPLPHGCTSWRYVNALVYLNLFALTCKIGVGIARN